MVKRSREERAAAVAAMRAEQERRERRSKRLIVGGVVALCLALITAVAIPLVGAQRERAAVEEAAAAPIEGAEEAPAEELTNNHVAGAVSYDQEVPMGGDHAGVWQNCGVYTEPVPTENVVHSLEHGAVWITYRSDLPADQVGALTDLVEGEPYGLLSPVEGLSAPVVATAWGVQLKVDDVADPRLAAFFTKYLQGPQTPEPGASCANGTGTPVA